MGSLEALGRSGANVLFRLAPIEAKFKSDVNMREAAGMEPITAKVAAAIDIVRKRIRQIRDRNELIGEQNTKAALIDRLLSALGWELQEIDEVRREYRRKPQDNPVDYALFLNRTERLLIEAKSLEKDLGDRKWISQNISYAAVVGVKWCVLTNGDEYRIYNSHAEVDVDEKLFRKVSISDSNSTFLIDTLVLLSKEKMRGSLLDELWKAHQRRTQAGKDHDRLPGTQCRRPARRAGATDHVAYGGQNGVPFTAGSRQESMGNDGRNV